MKLSVTAAAIFRFSDFFASPIFSQDFSVVVRPGAPRHGKSPQQLAPASQ
jgi:hypothetical protein